MFFIQLPLKTLKSIDKIQLFYSLLTITVISSSSAGWIIEFRRQFMAVVCPMPEVECA